MMGALTLATLFTCHLCVYVLSMVVIPERGNITLMNEKYIETGVFNVRRYSRRSPYVMNIYGVIKYGWANNITVDMYFNQFLHNEYRRSFVEMHYKFCDLVNKEPYVGGMFRNAGVVCPLPAGSHRYMNMTVPTANFPNVFPFEKGRVDFQMSVTATKEPVLHVSVVLTFKQNLAPKAS